MVTFLWNDYEFKLIQLGKGVFYKDVKGHRHSANSYELHYIIGGQGMLTTEEEKLPLKKGIFFLTGPNIYHEQATDVNDPLVEIFLYIHSGGKKTNDTMVSAFLSRHFCYMENPSIEGLFCRIYEEFSDKRLGWNCNVECLVKILLVELTRMYIPEYKEMDHNNDNLNDRRYWMIENAFLFHSEGITLTGLSEKIGLCERQTQRLLKKYYGKSFTQLKKEKGTG